MTTTRVYHRDISQNEEEWTAIRLGRVTGSQFGTVLSATGKEKATRTKYLLSLMGERLTRCPAAGYKNANMDRGHVYENDSRTLYELMNGVEIERVGFISLGEEIGVSPDGCIGDTGMWETKSREPHILLDLHFSGNIPSQDYAQCQGGLWVADREWIDYMAFWPGIKPFVKRLYRESKKISEIRMAVDQFLEELHETMHKYEKIGG